MNTSTQEIQVQNLDHLGIVAGMIDEMGLNTVRIRDKNIALAPLAPQFWGEMTLVFGFLPPELGGRGG
jgi:hypothetical protein